MTIVHLELTDIAAQRVLDQDVGCSVAVVIARSGSLPGGWRPPDIGGMSSRCPSAIQRHRQSSNCAARYRCSHRRWKSPTPAAGVAGWQSPDLSMSAAHPSSRTRRADLWPGSRKDVTGPISVEIAGTRHLPIGRCPPNVAPCRLTILHCEMTDISARITEENVAGSISVTNRRFQQLPNQMAPNQCIFRGWLTIVHFELAEISARRFAEQDVTRAVAVKITCSSKLQIARCPADIFPGRLTVLHFERLTCPLTDPETGCHWCHSRRTDPAVAQRLIN